MINGDTNLHLLHWASKGAGPAEDELLHHHGHQSPEQPSHPVGPLLPQGLEFERSPSESDSGSRRDEASVVIIERINFSFSSEECKISALFATLVISGVGNIVSVKMAAVSLFNYGVFLSLFPYLIYVPLCFAFVASVSRYGCFEGAIPESHMSLPKRPFAVMGFLDCLSSSMQCFASIYLSGSLLVLLPQASIPLSMILSRYMLGERYGSPQYVGAAVVFVGLLVSLLLAYRHQPNYLCEAIDLQRHCTVCSGAVTEEECLQLEAIILDARHHLPIPRTMLEKTASLPVEPNDNCAICVWVASSEASTGEEMSVFVWSIVMVLSCIPMCISSIYKQIKLRAHGDWHPIFFIGWLGLHQFLFSLVSAPSLGLATGIPLGELPALWNGLRCYLGIESVDSGCHPDSVCKQAFFFVSLSLLCQAVYMLSTVGILKYGSTSLLYLAMTLMVPMGNLVFSLPFIRTEASVCVSDIVALLVIVLGLLLYRFGYKKSPPRLSSTGASTQNVPLAEGEERLEQCHPLLQPLMRYAYV